MHGLSKQVCTLRFEDRQWDSTAGLQGSAASLFNFYFTCQEPVAVWLPVDSPTTMCVSQSRVSFSVISEGLEFRKES